MTGPVITQARLRELIDYDPETGMMTWRAREAVLHQQRTWNKRWAGKPVGSVHSEGYWETNLEGRRYLLHHLAWLYVHGELPKELDHKNLDRGDLRISNLRIATRSQNNANHPVRRRKNAHLPKGVEQYPNGYCYRICKDGKRKCVAGFKTPESAAQAYLVAAQALFGDFAREG